jgi:hypothetical protein
MAEMIVRYLIALPDGEEKKNVQIREQFPEGWEIVEELKAKKDSEVLHKVVQRIEKSKTDKEAELFIDAFKYYLEQQKARVIKTGKHFNIQLLVEAFKLYEEKFDLLGGYNSPRNNLFWRKVIGTIERYLPACYAQAFCQSIKSIVCGNKLNRSLKFKYSPTVIFYPLDSNPEFRLGVDYAAVTMPVTYEFLKYSSVLRVAFAAFRNLYDFENYVKQKTSTSREIIYLPNNPFEDSVCRKVAC